MTVRASAGGRPSPLRLITAALVVIAAFVLGAFVVQVGMLSFSGEAVFLDFRAFWGAARLALEGAATDAFDPGLLRAAEDRPGAVSDRELPWLYPPTWLLMIAPLGAFPFFIAWLAFCAASLLALIAAYRFALTRFAPDAGFEAAAVWIACPAVVLSLMLGQTSLLWTAGLIAAVAAIEARREALAGGLLALMTAKPQLGLLVPVALIAEGRWRVILFAGFGTVLLAGVATLAFGAEYWQTMWAAIQRFSAEMTAGGVRLPRQASVYGLLRELSVEHAAALVGQAAAALAAAIGLAAIWRAPTASSALKAAALCFALLLGPHYVFHYEMTVLAAGGFFLMVADAPQSSWRRVLLVLLWIGPAPGLAFPSIAPVALYGAPLAALGLITCLRAARA